LTVFWQPSGNPESLEFDYPNVKVVFKPSITTSLIQLLDQHGCHFKIVLYTILSAGCSGQWIPVKLDVWQWWKEYNIAECINIKESLDTSTPSKIFRERR
jgi:hypothetical protein